METNILIKFSQSISVNSSDEQIKNAVYAVLKELDSIYSYLITAKYEKGVLNKWIITYQIAQIDEYNTLKFENIIDDILFSIQKSRTSSDYVIGYKQPSIELMTKLFAPFVHRLAIEQSDKWLELEYEDAVSICWLTMLKLYRKGYYIHKSLLTKSFNNAILMELRHCKNKPEIVSLEQILYNNGTDDALSVADMLPDENLKLQQENKEDNEEILSVFKQVKAIIIDMIGERQFEQLFRDYGQQHTTAWSRKKMQQLKNKFKASNISYSSFGDLL